MVPLQLQNKASNHEPRGDTTIETMILLLCVLIGPSMCLNIVYKPSRTFLVDLLPTPIEGVAYFPLI